MTVKTISVLMAVVVLLVTAGCNSNDPEQQIEPNHITEEPSTVIIAAEGAFDTEDCLKRGLGNNLIMIESKYCGHCKDTKPDFMAACNETGIEPVIIDISEPEGLAQVNLYRVEARFTPTFIFGCNYFIGSKSKEEYVDLIYAFFLDEETK